MSADGWTTIDQEFCDENRLPEGEQARQSLIRFYDGATPTWPGVLADTPRLTVAQQITAELLAGGGGQVHRVVGPSGEGKSTIARQVAVDIARQGPDWHVLWRPRKAVLDVSLVTNLPKDGNWLLVSDDAEEIVADCFEAVRALESRSNVHFLLASRDVDWIRAQGDWFPWARHGVRDRSYSLRGVSSDDARLIVDAWAQVGALGQLASYNSSEERAKQFYEETRREAPGRESALLGGMLRVRFGPELDAHVRDLLGRLIKHKLPSTRNTLAHAFLAIAALHAVDVNEMNSTLLAEYLGISRDTVDSEVMMALGGEAAAVEVGLRLKVRHRAIAESAMRVAEAIKVPLNELYATLTRLGITMFKQSPDRAKDFRYLSRKLSDHPARAMASAKAAMETEPNDLRRVINMFIVFGANGLNDDLVELAERTVPGIAKMVNRAEAMRRFFYEWSVAEGKRGDHTIACWLNATALADLAPLADALKDSTEVVRDIEVRLAGLAPGFTSLAKAFPDDQRFGRGLRAVETLLRPWPVNTQTGAALQRHRAAADRLSVPEYRFDQCRDLLRQAVVGAWEKRRRELPTLVPNADNLKFDGLFDELAKYHVGR